LKYTVYISGLKLYVFEREITLYKVIYIDEAYILVPLAYLQDGRHKYKESSLTKVDQYSRIAQISTIQL